MIEIYGHPCDGCQGESMTVRRLQVAGNMSLFLCRRCWESEMRYRQAANRDCHQAIYNIILWSEYQCMLCLQGYKDEHNVVPHGVVCDRCQGIVDQRKMLRDKKIYLDLDWAVSGGYPDKEESIYTCNAHNRKHSLNFKCNKANKGSCLAGWQINFWFNGPDGKLWWGRMFGYGSARCVPKKNVTALYTQSGLTEHQTILTDQLESQGIDILDYVGLVKETEV